jgi:iron complex outermembrane recepter protein
MKGFLTLISLLLISELVLGQGMISGTVIDFSTKEPLEYVSIGIYTTKDSALVGGNITAPNGKFEISNLLPGTYYAVVSYLGYKTHSVSDLILQRNEKKILESIFLSTDFQNLQAVDIQGQRIATEFKTEKQTFSADNFQAAIGGTATDVLRNLPGVSINGEGQLSIRGNVGFVVMLNGRPVQGDPMMLIGQLPANSIEKIEWVSSPSAQYDAEGKAGIINIITVQGTTDGIFLQVNSRYGLPSIQNYDNAQPQTRYGSDFNLNWVKGKWDVSVGAAYLRNDQAGRRNGYLITYRGDTATHFPSNGERSINETNYSGRFTVGYSPNRKNNLNLGFYAG